MTISGRKDEDDSKKASLEKARANGFGQKEVSGRKKKSSNEVFEEIAEGRLPKLVADSFDALERALNSGNAKIALDAFYKLHKTYYNPDQKVIIEGPDQSTIHNNILVLQDSMNPKELAVVNAFKDLLKEGLQQEEQEAAEIIDVDSEVVDEQNFGQFDS